MSVRMARKWGKAQLQPVLPDGEGRKEADYLLAHVLGLDRLGLFANEDRILERGEVERFQEILERRRRREPLAYILGQQEFFGLTFEVTRDTLIPRADSECLVEVALKSALVNADVLDMCSGTGCLGIAYASQRKINRLHFSDLSAAALGVARRNCDRLLSGPVPNVAFLQGDFFDPVRESYDVIFLNPPYIPLTEYRKLEAELFYEPSLALVCGSTPERTVQHYLKLVQRATDHFRPGGLLLMEMHSGLANQVFEQVRENAEKPPFRGRWARLELLADLSGLPRVLFLSAAP